MAWNVIYRTEFTDLLGVDWRVDIEKDGYAGAINTMTASGEPLRIEYLAPSDELLLDPIKGSTATLNIECTQNFQYIDLYSTEDMTYKMKVYYNTSTLYWQGWVGTDYTEPYSSVPYTVSIVASDGIGMLKYIDYKDDSIYYTGRDEESDIILSLLSGIGYTQFTEFVNLYEDRMNSGTTDTPFNQIKIERLLFKDENCYTVLEEILKKYNAIIRQFNGQFIIYRPSELISDSIYGRIITSTTVTGTTLSPDQFLYRTVTPDSNLRDVDGGVLMMKAPSRRVVGKQDYGQAPSWIKNYNFDMNTYSAGAFQEWTKVGDNIIPLSSVEGFEGEKQGIALPYAGAGYPNTSNYITQTFATYSTITDDVIEFKFNYISKNDTDEDIIAALYMVIRDSAGTIWYERRAGDENELVPKTSAAYMITDNLTMPAGISTWQSWSKYIRGIPKDGTYSITIYCSTDANLTVGIKDIVFRATSNMITGHTKSYRWARERDDKGKSWLKRKRIFAYDYKDVEETVEREYIKENTLNGEETDVYYTLGDVGDTEIDDNLDQFYGSLLISTTDTLTSAAKRFSIERAADYLTGGVISSASAGKVVFTSSVAGTNFTGSTTITNVSGGLTGSVSTSQVNVSKVNLKKKLTFSGTSGSGDITVGETVGTIEYFGSLSNSCTAFVNTYKLDWQALNYSLTSSSNIIYVELLVGETVDVSYGQTDSNLTAVVETQTAYVAPVARIDEVTLSGTYGTANILCDGVTKLITYSSTPVLTNSASWSTRGNTEEQNLMELLVDEIADINSKGRQFIQLNMMELEGNPSFNMIGNLQDPINLSGSNCRVFVPNRATYNIRNREWSIDMIEIGDKAAPV